eukprot:SAG22_NODE_435_length_10524_cov_8.503789_5_plen_338_part_00
MRAASLLSLILCAVSAPISAPAAGGGGGGGGGGGDEQQGIHSFVTSALRSGQVPADDIEATIAALENAGFRTAEELQRAAPTGAELQELGLGLKARTELLRALEELSTPSTPPSPPEPWVKPEGLREPAPGENGAPSAGSSPMGRPVTREHAVWTKTDDFGPSMPLWIVDSSLEMLTAANFSARRPFYMPRVKGGPPPPDWLVVFCTTDSRYCRRGLLPMIYDLVEAVDGRQGLVHKVSTAAAGIDIDRPIRIGLVHTKPETAEANAAAKIPTGYERPGHVAFYHLTESDYTAGVLAPAYAGGNHPSQIIHWMQGLQGRPHLLNAAIALITAPQSED